jgi:hypothetical protein
VLRMPRSHTDARLGIRGFDRLIGRALGERLGPIYACNLRCGPTRWLAHFATIAAGSAKSIPSDHGKDREHLLAALPARRAPYAIPRTGSLRLDCQRVMSKMTSRLGGPYGARARCDQILPNLAADRRSGSLCPDASAVRPRSSPCASFLGEIDPNALHRPLCVSWRAYPVWRRSEFNPEIRPGLRKARGPGGPGTVE